MATTSLLITGATGNTGGEIIRQLSAQRISARALTRNPAKATALPYIEFVAGDLGDPASLVDAFVDIDALYLNVVPGPDALSQIDNAIAAARAAGVKQIVKLSGLHAMPESASAIIRMHAEADRRVRASGIGYTILRANSFFQNIESQLASIKAQGQFYLPLGESKQSLVDVADIAAVAILALTTDAYVGQNYDLTGPAALTFFDVATTLSKASGKTITYVPISNAAFADSLRSNGVPDAAADSVAELFAVFASGIYAAPTNDVSLILGRAPRGIADYVHTLFA